MYVPIYRSHMKSIGVGTQPGLTMQFE